MLIRMHEPIRSSLFKQEVVASLEHAKGTYIYEACIRDLSDKTDDHDPCGYRAWLSNVLELIRERHALKSMRVLDFGCGNGEFTVMLNKMGYDATGLDVNERCIRLARVLADENDVPMNRFALLNGNTLPFEENSFDVVLMISCLEHMTDKALELLIPEIHRVCRAALFVQVPSSMKVSDDHTSLRFVPWMPAALASAYVTCRGRRYRYLIAGSGQWDVVYRNLYQIERKFSSRFSMELAPAECSYPHGSANSPVMHVRGKLRIGRSSIELKLPLLHRKVALMLGRPIEYFYPYYNLLLRKKCG